MTTQSVSGSDLRVTLTLYSGGTVPDGITFYSARKDEDANENVSVELVATGTEVSASRRGLKVTVNITAAGATPEQIKTAIEADIDSRKLFYTIDTTGANTIAAAATIELDTETTQNVIGIRQVSSNLSGGAADITNSGSKALMEKAEETGVSGIEFGASEVVSNFNSHAHRAIQFAAFYHYSVRAEIVQGLNTPASRKFTGRWMIESSSDSQNYDGVLSSGFTITSQGDVKLEISDN